MELKVMRNKMTPLLPIVANCLYLGSVAFAQARPERFLIDDPRPLAKLAEAVERRFGVAVSYEDPEYSSASDVRDVTSSVSRDLKAGKQVLVPAGGRLDVSQALDALSTLRQAVDQHAVRGNPGRFAIRSAPHFILVPAQVRSASTQVMENYTPLLDTAVTLSGGNLNGLQAVMRIVESVARASGKKIVVGTVPLNLLNQTEVSLGSEQESARTVLSRTLRGLRYSQPIPTPVPLTSWQLFFDPGLRVFVLNLHVVQAERPGPFGGSVLEPVSSTR